MAHLHVSGLVKRFGATSVLDGIDLELRKGTFASVVGPSGCGKTTLVRILAGLEPASGGTVCLAGEAVVRPAPRVGVVFQEHALFPWRTALENVELGLEFAGVPGKTRRAAAREMLRAFGLAGCESRYPGQLSGGMRQRVALARTLVTGPELLLMDEPFNALDPRARAGVQRFLLQLWQERRDTVLFVTHSLDEAVLLSDEVIVLSPAPARVLDVVHLDLPRPRDPAGLAESVMRKRLLAQLDAASSPGRASGNCLRSPGGS
jgi:NitT/TauT family transport system ATP-binding protein